MDSKLNIENYHRGFRFYSLSVVISWIFWFLAAWISHAAPSASMGVSSLGLLGLVAPFIVALFLILPDKEMKKDFTSRIYNLSGIPAKYLVVTILIMPISILLAQAISLFFGYGIEQFQLRGGFTFTSGVFPVWFMLITAPLIEELAWHSYGTDCLRRKMNLFTTSMVFALIWVV